MTDPVAMHESDVLAALAELRWIPSPKDSTKARDLADAKRQGLTLKQVVEFFRTNPRSDWYAGLRELRKGIGYMTPVGERGEKVPQRSKAEVEAENAEAAARERSPEATKNAEVLRERLAKLGIRVDK